MIPLLFYLSGYFEEERERDGRAESLLQLLSEEFLSVFVSRRLSVESQYLQSINITYTAFQGAVIVMGDMRALLRPSVQYILHPDLGNLHLLNPTSRLEGLRTA